MCCSLFAFLLYFIYALVTCFSDLSVLNDDRENVSGKTAKTQLNSSGGKNSVLTEIFMCPNCTKTYRLKHSLTRHIKLECGKDPQYRCNECNRKFKHKYDLKVHLRSIHWNPKENSILLNKKKKLLKQ